MMKVIVELLVVYFQLNVLFSLKHFIADYLLQNEYMLKKFLPDWRFFWPLVAHCMMHAVSTYLITWVLVESVRLGLLLAVFDFTTHFFMDRIKAGPKYLGRFKALSEYGYKNLRSWQNDRSTPTSGKLLYARQKLYHNKLFWISLGLDQFVHNITNHIIELLIISYYVIGVLKYGGGLQHI